MHELLQRMHGRTVAVVGNGPLAADCSAEIDAAEVVVRFNHFYRYADGRSGRKITDVIQTFTTPWEQAQDKNLAALAEWRPRIWIGKKAGQYGARAHDWLGAAQWVGTIAHLLEPWSRFTTGGAFLCWLAAQAPQARVKVYGFPGGEAWARYIATDAKHYAGVAAEERAAVDAAIAALERCEKASAPYAAPKPAILVPVKRLSAGAPGKNRALLPRALEKIAAVGSLGTLTVVTDDPDLAPLVRGTGASLFAVPAIPAMADVTDTLRQWRAWTGHDGMVALVQATSPRFRPEWIAECLRVATTVAPVAQTATEVDFKISCLLTQERNGVWVQALPSLGAPSAPRQRLPKAVRLNGAVTAFHADALDFPSFHGAGRVQPVVVDAADSLDVDTPEQLAQALEAAP